MSVLTISPDMVPYWEDIMKLRHSFDSDSLDLDIKSTIKLKSATHMFLIKMEIMKLSQTVARIIDLRKYFKNLCEPVVIDGTTHYLDSHSEKLLMSEYKKYGYRLTLGAIEIVMVDAKDRHKVIPVSSGIVKIPDAIPMSLTKYHQRKEERIFFTKKLRMYYEDPRTMSMRERDAVAIDGMTVDLSATGVSIRLPKERISKKDGDIYLHMTGIESEFKFSTQLILRYNIVKTSEKNGAIYFAVTNDLEQDDKASKEFKSFSDSYIKTQRGRNKISVDNTEDAVNVKFNEQFAVTRVDSLPIFLSSEKGAWLPRAQFFTDNNLAVGKIASNSSSNKDFITALAKLDFVQDSLNTKDTFSEYIFVFPLKAASGKTHYFAIPYGEFYANPSYVKAASAIPNKEDLKLFRLDGSVTAPESQYHMTSSISSSVGDVFETLNREPIRKAKDLAMTLKRMIVLTDLTDSIESLKLVSGNTRTQASDSNINDIAKFILRVPKDTQKIYESRIESNDIRSEDRFEVELAVTARLKDSLVSTAIHGETVNVSTKGMKIKLSEPAKFKSGDELMINMPELTSRGATIFKNQPYNVVGGKIGDTEFRLVVAGGVRRHEGRKIMHRYIYKNLDKMKPSGADADIYGLSRILRNIFTHNLNANYGVISRVGSTRYVRTILASEKNGFIGLNPNTTNAKSVADLVKVDSFRNTMCRKSATINKENPYETFHLLILPKQRKSGLDYYVTRVIEDFTEEKIRGLMTGLTSMGNPKLLRIKVTKKSRVFNKYFTDELNYISMFSSAKAVKIEKDIRDTTGIVEMTDITDLIQASYKR